MALAKALITFGWSHWLQRKDEDAPSGRLRIAATSWLVACLAFIGLLSMPLGIAATLTYPFEDRTWWPAEQTVGVALGLIVAWIAGIAGFWVALGRTEST